MFHDPRGPEDGYTLASSTSLGPDGMPLGAWKALGSLAEAELWDALQMMSDPARRDAVHADWPDLNTSSMVFLPKLPDGVLGSAADTRPLNISNGECRILANAVRLGFERAMSSWVSSMQRGFLPGRSLLLNVIEMEHRMQAESLRGQDGSAFC